MGAPALSPPRETLDRVQVGEDSDWRRCSHDFHVRAPTARRQSDLPKRLPRWRQLTRSPGQLRKLIGTYSQLPRFSLVLVVSKMSAASSRRVIFGTSQERRLFPLHYAPDRLGSEMSRRLAPHLGPGRYDNHEVGLFKYLERWNFWVSRASSSHLWGRNDRVWRCNWRVVCWRQ